MSPKDLEKVNVAEVVIREIEKDELHHLDDLLYAVLFQPDRRNPIPRNAINLPEIRIYIQDFGRKKGDYCLVAVLRGTIIGGVWVRILAGEIKGFGHIDDKTPEFAIAVFSEFQNLGIGTRLMGKMISHLKNEDYHQASLSVQKQNYAVKMYQNLGFEISDETDEDYIMLLKLRD
nr:GNAT family N-acetyltransferase [uncultured Desulfuromonas sp.]